jgi:hypothetical protein
VNLEELQQTEIESMNTAYYRLVDLIITLSTGAVALSVTFRTSFSSEHAHTVWLKISWVAFIIAIIAGLFAHYGRVAHHKRMANIYGLKAPLKSPTVYLHWWATLSKWIMPSAFVAGLISFALFAWSCLE